MKTDPRDMTIRQYFDALDACPGRCEGCEWKGISCDLIEALHDLDKAWKRPMLAMAMRILEEQGND